MLIENSGRCSYPSVVSLLNHIYHIKCQILFQLSTILCFFSCELFQNCMSISLQGLEGFSCLMDDILMYGNSREEHFNRLMSPLERLQKHSITLNKRELTTNLVKLLHRSCYWSKTGPREGTRHQRYVRAKATDKIAKIQRYE